MVQHYLETLDPQLVAAAERYFVNLRLAQPEGSVYINKKALPHSIYSEIGLRAQYTRIAHGRYEDYRLTLSYWMALRIDRDLKQENHV